MADNQILDGLKRKSNMVKECFGTSTGQAVLKLLSDEFDRDDLRGADVNETYYNLGARDLVVFLKQLNEVEGLE